MDGKTALIQVRNVLGEDAAGKWMDNYTTYTFLWQGAQEIKLVAT